jgi:hypothetical protein
MSIVSVSGGLSRLELQEQSFSSVGMRMEGKIPPQGLRGRDRGRSIRPCGFPEFVHCLFFILYLKILGFYFAYEFCMIMHILLYIMECFSYDVLYDYW